MALDQEIISRTKKTKKSCFVNNIGCTHAFNNGIDQSSRDAQQFRGRNFRFVAAYGCQYVMNRADARSGSGREKNE